jgi:CSLREA domain-containing protein
MSYKALHFKVLSQRAMAFAIAFAIGAPLVAPRAAQAATFTVTHSFDDNNGTCAVDNCSLRNAIKAANATPDDDVITAAPTLASNAVALIGGELVVEGAGGALTIDGNKVLVVSSTGRSRLFRSHGAILTLRRMQMGSANSGQEAGGAILNQSGTLSVEECDIRYCVSGLRGGAIASNFGVVNLLKSNVFGNTAPRDGAISGQSAILNVSQSYLHDNRASVSGGAIGGSFGPSKLTNTTISHNTVNGPDPVGGGAVALEDGTLEFDSCTLVSNAVGLTAGGATDGGNRRRGGVYVTAGQLHRRRKRPRLRWRRHHQRRWHRRQPGDQPHRNERFGRKRLSGRPLDRNGGGSTRPQAGPVTWQLFFAVAK